MAGTVELLEPLGSDLMVHISADVPPVRDSADIAELGKETEAGGPLAGRTLVTARFSPRSTVKVGGSVSMSLDTERLHFFDAASGASIWQDASHEATSAQPASPAADTAHTATQDS
jgi:multiple sugar transport system ATP-binding protein